MSDKFIKRLVNNRAEALNVFNEWYDDKAREEGEDMMYDDRFYGDDSDEWEGNEIELYEDFAHTTGYSASYYGAYGVIKHFMNEVDEDINPDDEELQVEVMDILDVNPY